jgi:ectoine hydroxylase-related dioxygenase (phytanoyl-CoA dioxygenase family)
MAALAELPALRTHSENFADWICCVASRRHSNYNLLMDAGILRANIERDGFAIVPECLDSATLQSMCEQFDDSCTPARNLLALPNIQAVASSPAVRKIVEAVLGPDCFAVRGMFFNKTRATNWKVAWHQDLTIAVRERKEADGFGPWTTKAGVQHVQPPADVMAGMLAIRLHLDENDADNGPLRVIAGTHRAGRLSSEKVAAADKANAVRCTVAAGGALVMRPLLLHASSESISAKSRRVLHFEFASAELPSCLDWHDRIRESTTLVETCLVPFR